MVIAFLFYALVLWLVWRWVSRPISIIEPRQPMSVTVMTPSIVVNIHVDAVRIAPKSKNPEPF